jgi:hypothetical protein
MFTIDLDFENDDLDQFEETLDAALANAKHQPKTLFELIGAATAFLDAEDRYEGNVDPTHINNATSTVCRAARLLMLAALPSLPVVESVGNRGTGAVPFGDVNFTDGVRVGYGRFDDRFLVFEMETFGAPKATRKHLKAAEAYIMNHYVEALPTTA